MSVCVGSLWRCCVSDGHSEKAQLTGQGVLRRRRRSERERGLKEEKGEQESGG